MYQKISTLSLEPTVHHSLHIPICRYVPQEEDDLGEINLGLSLDEGITKSGMRHSMRGGSFRGGQFLVAKCNSRRGFIRPWVLEITEETIYDGICLDKLFKF